MPVYKCELCNFETKIKPHFNRHIGTAKHKKKYLNSKSHELSESKEEKNSDQLVSTQELDNTEIKETQSENILSKTEFECEMCGRILSSKGHLTRHIRSFCPENKSKKESKILKDLLEEQKQQFETERKNLYKQIEKLLDKVGNTTNIQSNIKNTITLNNYGNENLSHITNHLKTQLVKIPYGMIPKLIEAVHFNDDHPENKNIALTNSRDNKIKVFSDNRWVYKDKEETINDLVDGKYYILDTHFEEVNESLETESISDFIKFKEYFNLEDKEFVNKLKKDCELVLLNNR
jgi:hypothetical protein